MWEAGKRLICTATGEYMREATITIFILLFHLILPGVSTFCSRSFPSFSPPFTLLLHLKMSLRNAIINLRTDTRKLAFFSFFSHICPWPLSFFVRLNKWRVFPDLLLYFCVLRSARIGYNTA